MPSRSKLYWWMMLSGALLFIGVMAGAEDLRLVDGILIFTGGVAFLAGAVGALWNQD